MTLIRLFQRASILASMTFISLPFQSNPAQAETKEFCIITSNGKTLCGKPRGIERMCITTDGSNTVCGKFKSAKEEQGEQPESIKPSRASGSQTVVNGITFSVKGCTQSDTDIKCIFSLRNNRAARNIGFEPNSAVITDSSGKTYRATFIEMGGQNISWTNVITATPGIDYEAAFTFKDIQVAVKKAQLLSFPLDGKLVNLRNIIVSN
jgi:hypothetical protein